MNNSDLRVIFGDIISILSQLNNEDDVFNFFRDLLSENEMIEFSKRLQTADMLSEKMSYVDIERETGMSSTTIARVSKFLNGENNGYKKAFEVLKLKSHHLNGKD